jgi:hypothetical protein
VRCSEFERSVRGKIMTAAAVPVSIEETMAGFIVWLARRRAPLVQRRRCVDSVELFLRWQHDQCEQGESHCGEDTYYAEMRRAGADDAQVTDVRTAVGMFRHYLITRHH